MALPAASHPMPWACEHDVNALPCGRTSKKAGNHSTKVPSNRPVAQPKEHQAPCHATASVLRARSPPQQDFSPSADQRQSASYRACESAPVEPTVCGIDRTIHNRKQPPLDHPLNSHQIRIVAGRQLFQPSGEPPFHPHM